MAESTHTIDIILNAVNDTGQGLSDFSGSLENAVGKISSVTAPLAGFANQVLETEAAVTALGMAFLSLAVHQADEFGAKMAEINSLTNGNEETFNQLSKSVQDFAVNSTSSMDEIYKATYDTTSVIGDQAKTMELLEVAQKGAVVGATDLATASGLLSNIMASYGQTTLTGSDYTNALEKNMATMFAAVQNGKTTMSELSSEIGGVAPIASAANVNLESLAAAFAAVTSAGISTAEAGTKIGALLEELLNPSEKLAPVLNGLSVQVDGLPKVLQALQSATGGASDKMLDLFGSSEAAQAAIILANDKTGKFKGTMDAMGDSIKNFNTQYENMAGGVGDSTAKLENSFTVLLQKIGTPLQDEFASILDSFAKITQGFSISIDNGTFAPVFDAFSGFEADLVDYLDKIAAALPEALNKVDFSQWLDSLKELGFDISSLFDGVDLTSPEGLAHAIQLLVNGLETLNHLAAGIIEVWKPVVQTFFAATEQFIALDASTEKSIGHVLGVAQVFESLKGYVEGSISAIDGIGKSLQVIAGIKVAETLTSLAPSLAPLVASAGSLAAVAVALGIVGTVAYETASAVSEHIDTLNSLEETQRVVAKDAANYADKLALVSKETGITVTTQDELIQKIQAGELVLNKTSGKYENQAQLLARISEETGVTVKSQEELTNALEKGLITYDKTTGVYSSYDKIVEQTANSTKNAAITNEQWMKSVDAVAQGMELSNSKGEKLWQTWQNLDEAEQSLLRAGDAGLQGFIRYEDGLYKVITTGEKVQKSQEDVKKAVEDTSKSNVKGSEEWKRVQDAMQAATDKANDFKLKAQELNAKKFEAILTASVDLKVAEVEAQTKRIEAAFASLNEGIKSTGDTLTGLADSLVKNTNPNNESIIKKMMEQENDRRQQEFDLQKTLTEQQIDIGKIKIDKLRKGDAMIKVDAGNLSPHLQALMTEIFKEIQIKATEEGMNLLMGLNQ